MRVLIVMLVASVVSACAVMESRFDADTEGMVYYLPRSLVKITVTSQENGDVSFGFDSDEITDVGNRYALNYRNNAFFHDRLCVLVDENGYLSSIEYASEDKTPKIAVALAELASEAGGGIGPRFVDPAANGQKTVFLKKVPPPPPRPFSLRFDPLDPEKVRSANNEINRRLNLSPADGYRLEFPDLRSVRTQRQACDGKGVCFRTKIKTAVRVVKRVGASEEEVAQVETTTGSSGADSGSGTGTRVGGYLEVYGPVGNIDLSRAFLVEKIVRLKFTKGALTQLIMKKPSEALSAAMLPVSVLNVLLAVPSNFVDNITGTKQARDAYQNELSERVAALQSINTNLAKLAPPDRSDDSDVATGTFKLGCAGGSAGFGAQP